MPVIAKALLVTVAGLCGLFAAAPAQAFTLGIGDQSIRMLDDPRFQALGVRHTRIVVPYNMMSDRESYDRYAYVLQALEAQDVEVLVAFNHRIDSRTYLPSVAAYMRNFKRFRKAFPWIREYSPWNEANHSSQPTARRPARAAAYYNAVRANCRDCQIVAADVLDQRGMEKYLRKFRRYARGKPRLWGLHNYKDANYKTSKGTRAILRAVKGKVWLTETGGIVNFGSKFPYSTKRAAKRTTYLFKLADRYSKKRSGQKSRITRLYNYSWRGEVRGARFDAGLVGPNGNPRPAYKVFKAKLKNRSR